MKSLNQNLQKVIRVLKDSGNTLNDITNKQLSDLSGVNTKYILTQLLLYVIINDKAQNGDGHMSVPAIAVSWK